MDQIGQHPDQFRAFFGMLEVTEGGLPTLPEPQTGAFQLQVWNYTPIPMPDNKTVDPLSLTLSLQNDSDERVQGALEELQEHFPW